MIEIHDESLKLRRTPFIQYGVVTFVVAGHIQQKYKHPSERFPGLK